MFFIRLSGLDLNPSLQLLERYQSYQVAQSVNRTVGGRAIVYATPLRSGRKLTLKATQDSGWLTLAMAIALQEMAAQVGGHFQLEMGDDSVGGLGQESYNVIFRHNEPPALELEPIVFRPVYADSDMFTGTIKLLTID